MSGISLFNAYGVCHPNLTMKSKRRKATSVLKKAAKSQVPKSSRQGSRSRKDLGAAAELLTAADAVYRERRSRYEQFLALNQERPPLERATAWLEFVASDVENYGDYEALVYLSSRGQNVDRLIEMAVESWKEDERLTIASSLRGAPIHNPATGKTTYTNPTAQSELRDIEHASEFSLRPFWYGHRVQDLSLDATMLRTVEWCQIGGFDPWWRRLARLTDEDIIRGGLEVDVGVFYLFNMTRSNLALSMMQRALLHMLEAVELRRYGNPPWVSIRPFPVDGGRADYRSVADIAYASALVFATSRIRGSEANTELIREALSLIQRMQHPSGAWPNWIQESSEAIEETAIAIHALAVLRPLGWERQIRKAANWLLGEQKPGGCWVEEGSPDPTYLTVLVLDALALADGKDEVTYRPSPAVYHSKPKPRRFKVAVSFPGNVRERVEPVVRLLQKKLGVGTVFYDRDFAGELARPDLDVHLYRIYHDDADLVVVFIAEGYAERQWCGLEWRYVRELIKTQRGKDVMFLLLDDADLPAAMLSLDGYADISGRTAQHVMGMIQQRLNSRDESNR